MQSGRKVKVSLSLPEDLVASLDRQVASGAARSRSAVVEQWLRRGAEARAESDLRAAVVTYYEGLDADSRAEEANLSRALSRASRKLLVGDVGKAPKKLGR